MVTKKTVPAKKSTAGKKAAAGTKAPAKKVAAAKKPPRRSRASDAQTGSSFLAIPGAFATPSVVASDPLSFQLAGGGAPFGISDLLQNNEQVAVVVQAAAGHTLSAETLAQLNSMMEFIRNSAELQQTVFVSCCPFG